MIVTEVPRTRQCLKWSAHKSLTAPLIRNSCEPFRIVEEWTCLVRAYYL